MAQHRFVITTLCLLFLSSGITYADSFCVKNGVRVNCPKPTEKTAGTEKKTDTGKKSQTPASKPRSAQQLPKKEVLSKSQLAMRDAFEECIRYSTSEDPTTRVLDFVYAELEKREASLFDMLLKKLNIPRPNRGSAIHHGHEVCLKRAFGIKIYQTNVEIDADRYAKFEVLDIPQIEISDTRISVGRRSIHRLVRPWVREYLEIFARDYSEAASVRGHDGISSPKLRATSMIRSADVQNELVKIGLSPANCKHEFLCSSHTTGSAIDIGGNGLTKLDRKWIESRLVADQKERKIFFIIEDSHYHLFVLPPTFLGEN